MIIKNKMSVLARFLIDLDPKELIEISILTGWFYQFYVSFEWEYQTGFMEILGE